MSYLKDKRASFYMMIIAAVLALIGLIFYRTGSIVEAPVVRFILTGVALTAVMMVLGAIKSKPRILNLCATVIALVLAWGLIQSVNAQLDPLGWYVSGLYSFEQVRGYIFFAVLTCVAVLLDIIASFIDLQK